MNRRTRTDRRMALTTLVVVGGLLARTPAPALAAPGDLDPSFGTGGKVTTAFAAGSIEEAYAVAVQPNGKIVAAGPSDAVSGGFALARYLSR